MQSYKKNAIPKQDGILYVGDGLADYTQRVKAKSMRWGSAGFQGYMR